MAGFKRDPNRRTPLKYHQLSPIPGVAMTFTPPEPPAPPGPCPGCVITLTDGFAPLTDGDYFDDVAADPTYFTHTIGSNFWRIDVSVPAGIGVGFTASFTGYDPSSGSRFTGQAPQQLYPCGHSVQIEADYELVIAAADPTGETLACSLNFPQIGPPDSVSGLVGGNRSRSGPGTTAGTLTLVVDPEAVFCDSCIVPAWTFTGNFNTASSDVRTGHILISNVTVTDLGL